MNIDQLKFHYKNLLFNEVAKYFNEDTKITTEINGFVEAKERGVSDKIAIAGGAVRDRLSGDKIKDIDVFCENKEVEEKVLDFFENKSDKILNENSQLANFVYKNQWFQVIKGKYFNITTSDLINSFDFTICCGMVTKNDVFFNEHFFEDCLTKRLRVNVIPYPLSTLERLQKYIKKGYTACNGTLLEISKAVQTVDFNNPEENDLEFYPDGGARFLGVD